MTPTEVKSIIQEQLPVLIDDPSVRDFVLRTVSNHYAPKKETESYLERMMAKIDNTLSEMRLYNEKNDRKWESFTKEQAQKWEEHNRKWEEHNRKWDENNRKWDENNRKWDENNRKWDEQHKANLEILLEIKNMNRKHDSTIGALGSRWGLRSEASFRSALKGILEDSFGVQVLNVTEFDDKGEVFGRPEQIELDIIVKNGILIICEIKSSMSRSDMFTFYKKILLYEECHNKVANRKIVISPMVDDRVKELSKELGIEIYSYAEDADI